MDDIYQSAYTGEQIDAAIKRVLEGAQGGDQGGSSNPPAVLINKRITSNGSYSAADDGVDGYSSVSVNVKVSGDVGLPTLKTPTLILDNYNAKLIINDAVNGDHTEQYFIYYDDEYIGSTGEKSVDLLSMTDFTGNDDLKVVATASQFNDSTEAVIMWEQPKVISPTIEIDSVNGVLNILTYDINNTDQFKVYVDDVLTVTTSNTTVVLPEYIQDHLSTQIVSVVATGKTAYYLDSMPSTASWYYLPLGTEGLTYEKYDTYAVCTGLGTAIESDIIIAAFYEGLPVTKITNSAFRSNNTITSVYIPEGITSIEIYAFQNCYNLTAVTIPATLTALGSKAFYNCNALKSVYISDIVAWCNMGWTKDYSLEGLPDMEGFTNGDFDLYLHGELLTDLVIPEGLQVIKAGRFQFVKSITKVVFPDSLTTIGAGAFGSLNITSPVRIPASVSWVGEKCFQNCTKLTGAILENTYCSDRMFNVCDSMEYLAISKRTKSFGDNSITNAKYVYYEGTEEEYASLLGNNTPIKDILAPSRVTVYYNVDLDNFEFPEPAYLSVGGDQA